MPVQIASNLSNLTDWLSHEIRQGNVAFLVGAGISHDAPSGLPLGDTLTKNIVESLCASASIKGKEKARVIRLSKRLRPEVVFDLLYEEIGYPAFDIFRILQKGQPNLIHQFLSKSMGLGNIVVTTNLDVKIEQAYNPSIKNKIIKSKSMFAKCASHADLPCGCLFKLHGSLSVNNKLPDRSTLIAALRQVGKGLDENKAIMLERILQRKYIVVLGYSGRDEFDIIPKITTTKEVKSIIWVVHPEIKKAAPTGLSELIPDYLKTLLENIDGQTTALVANSQDFVSRIWPNITSDPLPDQPITQICEHRSAPLQRDCLSSLLLIGDLCMRASAPEFADTFYRQLSDHLQTTEYYRFKAFFRRSLTCRLMGKLSDMEVNARSALYWAKCCGDQDLIARAYNLLGITARKQAKWSLAVRYYKTGLRLIRNYKVDPEYRANLKNNLGIVLNFQGKHREALKYLHDGLRSARQDGDIESISESLNNIGIAYTDIGEYSKALKCFEESMEIKKLIGHMYGLGQTYHNMGLAYEYSNELASAISSYTESLKIKNEKTHDLHGIAQTEANLARIYSKRGELQKAHRLARKSLTFLKKQKDIFGMAEASETLAKIEFALHNYNSAQEHLTAAISFFGSLLRTKDVERCKGLEKDLQRRGNRGHFDCLGKFNGMTENKSVEDMISVA